MNAYKNLFFCTFLLFLVACATRLTNQETAKVHVEGTCEICRNTIESAGTKKGLSKVSWDAKTKEATVVFNQKNTTLNDVMKMIADAGYKNDLYPADKDAYEKLPKCCKYSKTGGDDVDEAIDVKVDETLNTSQKNQATFLAATMDAYFGLAAAITIENPKETHEGAKKLWDELKKIDITMIPKEDVEFFRSMQNKLDITVGKIMETKDFKVQRTQFATLSASLRELLRKHPLTEAVYVKQCKESSERVWLTLEEEVTKNPYLGYEVLECGEILETIAFKK